MNKKIVIAVLIILVIGIAAGVFVLSQDGKQENIVSQTSNENNNSSSNTTTLPSSANNMPVLEYRNGTYTAEGSYAVPDGGKDSVSVTLTITEDSVTAVEVVGNARGGDSRQYQNLFIKGISGKVVGQKLDVLTVGKINGSSLTGTGFNEAVAKIRSQALN